MNASSWRKAVDSVAQVTPANLQVQAAAMAELQQLESLPLSALSADDSGLPQVIYDSQQPLVSSTPRATLTITSETPTEAYHQIIPGISDCLYPTLIADGSLSTHVPDNCGMLQDQITSEVDKCLQEWQRGVKEMLITLMDGTWLLIHQVSSKKTNYVEHDEEEVPESDGQDTSENGAQNAETDIPYYNELETITEEDEDEDSQMATKQDIDNSDMIMYDPEESEEEPFNMTVDDTSKDPAIVMGKLVTTAFVSDDVHIPTEKVGC